MSCCTSLASYIDKIPKIKKQLPDSSIASEWLTVERGTIRYTKTGNPKAKETVILMPDPPNTIEHMQELVRLLEPHFQVIAFEGLGFGFSNAALSYDFSFEHNADTIMQVLDKLSIKKAILALTCVSALSGLIVAKKRADIISGLVFGQTPSIEEAKKWAKRVDFKGLIGTPFVGQVLLKLLKKSISDLWFKNALAKGADRTPYLAKTLTSFQKGARFSLASGLQALHTSKTPESAMLAKQKAIVLWGKLDRSHKSTDKKAILNLLPNGKIVELENCAHFPDIEAPKEFAKAIFEVSLQ
ncbi:MAG: alpha/beta hydrolase [Kangiellaceae bacterium]|nr:alpha/beta hydrolase [Kangiellaceae bacterium]